MDLNDDAAETVKFSPKVYAASICDVTSIILDGQVLLTRRKISSGYRTVLQLIEGTH